MRRLTWSITIAVALWGCGAKESKDKEPEASGKQVLFGVSGNTKNYEETNEAWSDVFAVASDLGVGSIHVQVGSWAEVEAVKDQFDLSYFDGFKALQPASGLSYSLDIATPLGLGAMAIPDHVTFTDWADQTLRDEYFGYVDAILAVVPQPTHVVLHIETAESYFADAARSNQVDDFADFLTDTAAYLRQRAPGVRVGTYGAKTYERSMLDKFNASMDFFGFSYLPDRGDEDFGSVLSEAVAMAGDKTIALVEAGVTTASTAGSSEARQQEYFQSVFDAIASNRTKFEYVSMYQAFDEDREVTGTYVPAMFPDWTVEQQQSLIDWLSSIGIKRVDGAAKAAYTVIKERVAAANP